MKLLLLVIKNIIVGFKDMVKYKQQREWVVQWLKVNYSCDVLNRDFHDEFADEFKVKQVFRMIGANECPQAMRVLSRMYHKDHYLNRSAIGLSQLGMGFPKWVYVYSLKSWLKDAV